MRRMLATRESNSIGFTANSSQPVAMAVSRSLSSAYADRPMIGMWPVWASFLRRRTTSQRSSTGISRSISMTSGRSVSALLTIIGDDNLEIIGALKTHLEHVAVVVVVFDVEHFGHDQPLFNQLFIRSPSRGGTSGQVLTMPHGTKISLAADAEAP